MVPKYRTMHYSFTNTRLGSLYHGKIGVLAGAAISAWCPAPALERIADAEKVAAFTHACSVAGVVTNPQWPAQPSVTAAQVLTTSIHKTLR
jgi:glycine/serine hydroxymethyltransferase